MPRQPRPPETPVPREIADIPPYWRRTPGDVAQYRQFQEDARLDGLHEYWRERWTFADGVDPPFPFYVRVRDDEAGRALLWGMDALGIPYHINTYIHPDSAPSIFAPLWDKQVPSVIDTTQTLGMWFTPGRPGYDGTIPPPEDRGPEIAAFFALWQPVSPD